MLADQDYNYESNSTTYITLSENTSEKLNVNFEPPRNIIISNSKTSQA